MKEVDIPKVEGFFYGGIFEKAKMLKKGKGLEITTEETGKSITTLYSGCLIAAKRYGPGFRVMRRHGKIYVWKE